MLWQKWLLLTIQPGGLSGSPPFFWIILVLVFTLASITNKTGIIMKNISFLFLLFLTLTAYSQESEKWIQLFNGKDLTGWDLKIRGHELNENYQNTFRVENGVLKVGYDGYKDFNQQYGHIFYKKAFSHYLIRVEYRFVGDQAPGGEGWAFRNSGIMVHGQSAKSMLKDQDFPISIEVQLLGGRGDGERSTCNLCTPGTHVVLDGKLEKRHCINSNSKTFHGDQWVTAEVLVLGNDVIKHIVNGDTVFAYTKPQIGGGVVNGFDPNEKLDGMPLSKGTISLQSESHPIEFRKVELLDLSDQYPQFPPVVFQHANIIDGKTTDILRDATLVVVNGKIKTISQGQVAIPKNATVFDLGGKYLMPGLIDAHVHIRDFGSAKRALLSGITTARSMGVAHFMDVGMAELAAENKIDAPEIISAGYHVRPKPDDGFYMNFPQLSDLMDSGIRGEMAMQRMGKAIVDKGVDWIKTNATARAGLPQTDPREPYYDEKEMKALVEEGAKAGIPVAAHAHGDEGGRAAVLGGVKSIEHGTYLSKSTLQLMKERGTYLVPTIAVVNDLTQPGGDYDNPLLTIRGRHMLPRVREMAKNAYQMGVKIIAATDTGYGKNSTLRLGLELQELVNIGMSPYEAIKAATYSAAEMMDLTDHTGHIAEGMDADLLIIEKNPYESVSAVNDPLIIVNNGKVVLNRLKW